MSCYLIAKRKNKQKNIRAITIRKKPFPSSREQLKLFLKMIGHHDTRYTQMNEDPLSVCLKSGTHHTNNEDLSSEYNNRGDNA